MILAILVIVFKLFILAIRSCQSSCQKEWQGFSGKILAILAIVFKLFILAICFYWQGMARVKKCCVSTVLAVLAILANRINYLIHSTYAHVYARVYTHVYVRICARTREQEWQESAIGEVD